VSSSDSDGSDSSFLSDGGGLSGELGEGLRSSHLESSLLYVDGHATTGCSSLMSAVSSDTHDIYLTFPLFGSCFPFIIFLCELHSIPVYLPS